MPDLVAMSPDPTPRHMPPEHGCASCRVLWDDEVIRRNHARRCANKIPPLGIHPIYTSPRVALCGPPLIKLQPS